MRTKMIMDQLKNNGIVPVFRGAKTDTILDTVQAFLNADVNVIEITIESPEGISSIQEVKKSFGSSVLVGAGTVLTEQDASNAIAAGADFIVTPILNKKVIEIAKKANVFVASGALTPTEIYEAYEAGADLVKVFPASVFGASYLKDLKGPLGFIPIMPTGGINEENIQAFLEAGAICVGVGSAIYKFETTREITEATKRYKNLI